MGSSFTSAPWVRANGRTPVTGATSPRRAPRGERGAVAVEFALLVPMLLLITFGLIQYGFYFWAMQGGSDIARNAARMSAVGDPATCAGFRERVADTIDDFGAARGTPTVKRSYTNGPGNTAAEIEVGDLVAVTVSFQSIDLGLPLLPFTDGGTVTETVQARVDYVPSQPEPCS